GICKGRAADAHSGRKTPGDSTRSLVQSRRCHGVFCEPDGGEPGEWTKGGRVRAARQGDCAGGLCAGAAWGASAGLELAGGGMRDAGRQFVDVAADAARRKWCREWLGFVGWDKLARFVGGPSQTGRPQANRRQMESF